MDCGYSFAGAPAKTTSAIPEPEEPIEEARSLPQMRGLEVDIEVQPEKDRGVKFGNLIGTAAPPDNVSEEITQEIQATSEKVLSDFLKEAGTLRNTSGPQDNSDPE